MTEKQAGAELPQFYQKLQLVQTLISRQSHVDTFFFQHVQDEILWSKLVVVFRCKEFFNFIVRLGLALVYVVAIVY